jgi:hydroxymethylbilane synthase
MPKGLFTKEIQEAMLNNEVDVAVHSLKDLPTDQHKDLLLAAISERADPHDALISRAGLKFSELPKGARVGTSSTRRKSQLLNLRPDLVIEDLRGNVDTRLRKLDEGQYDAIILAVAGLTRLGLQDRISQILSADIIVPAVGQGALGIEVRKVDEMTRKHIAILDDEPTRRAVIAERALLAALGGGCQVPIAAYAESVDDKINLRACVASVDGATVLKRSLTGPQDEAESIGNKLAQELLQAGADKLLKDF